MLSRTDPDVRVRIGQRAPKDFRTREHGIEDFAAPYIGDVIADAARQGLLVRVVRLVEDGDQRGKDVAPWIDRAEIWFEPAGAAPRFEVAPPAARGLGAKSPTRSSLTRLLADVFPDLAAEPAAISECWVSKVLRLDPAGTQVLSDAIDAVERHGQIEVLKRRIRNEHPSHREHRREYDSGLLDALTEACALAWVDLREIGTPVLTATTLGSPDVRINSDGWLDAKAIHPSATDQARTEKLLRTGGIDVGTVTGPGPGFLGKFETAYANALQKFERVPATRKFVFFNLTAIDIDSMPLKRQIFGDIRRWADRKERNDPSTRVAICFAYDWRSPVRDPFS